MTTAIAFPNEKGGTGKSTLVAEFAYALKSMGYKVLCIDLDGQKGNLSWTLGADKDTACGIYDVFQGDCSLADAVQASSMSGGEGAVDIVASDARLLAIATNWDKIGRDVVLRQAIAALPADAYDYILIDPPGALNTLTINALAAADELIIPTLTEASAIAGMTKLAEAIDPIRSCYNPDLEVRGVVIGRFQSRTRVHRRVAEKTALLAEQTLHSKLFDSTIRASVAVQDAQESGKTVGEADSASSIAHDYMDLVREYLGEER